MWPTKATAYGTSSLLADPNLRNSNRRPFVKYGVVGLTAAALAMASVGYMYDGEEPVTTATGTTATVDYTQHITTSSVTTASYVKHSALTTTTSTTTTAMSVDTQPTISGWQSSYVDGETKMMEPIKGLKWTKKASTASTSSSVLRVDASKRYQEIFGFGGAFTEASAIQFAKLSKEKQDEVLTLFFDKENGSGYEIGRVPMGSCDFSETSYSYAEVANDTNLTHFDVSHDTKWLIPFLQRALAVNPDLKLFLSPWSPPAWMKTPNSDGVRSMDGSAIPKGLDDEFRDAWALYFSKFISTYKDYGIPFWGLTPQNEPEAIAPWEACAYTPVMQADFLANYLGPVMARDHPEVNIIVFDFVRGSMVEWAETIFNHPEAKKYVDGIAFHWYGSWFYDVPHYGDGVGYHEKLNETHYIDETKFILATEAANCPGIATGDEAWFRGQRYAHDIIADFNNWVVGWVDWNLILDHTGGPNHLGNVCDAPIVIDETEEDYFLQPMYYFIQHFSKYVPVGSRRIQSDIAIKFKSPGDAQLHPHYPVELNFCDSSSRQQLALTPDGKLEFTGTDYCIGLEDPEKIDLVRSVFPNHQVVLKKCEDITEKWTLTEHGQLSTDEYCLTLNHGSTDNGVRVMADACVKDVDYQKWKFTAGGTMQSQVAAKCVTAGYAFVQATAFVTPDDKKVLVVMNENTEPAEFKLENGNNTLDVIVPPGAIQTYKWA